MSESPITLSSGERALLEAVDADAGAMAERMKAWSRINSGSRNGAGLERMRAALLEAYAPLGATIEEAALAPSEVVLETGEIETVEHPPAVKITQRPDAPIQVALTGHYDTVFPADCAFQDWRMLDADTINGPGTADMKGGLLVMARALQALEAHPDKANVGYTALVSPDEEIGSPGSAPLLAEIGARADCAMTYEPALADGGLAGARKGSGNFTLVVRGRAAHAGREHHLGRNALEATARFIVALQDLNGARAGATFNVGEAHGGAAVNVVPDLAICRFNVRMVEPADMGWAMSEIERLAAATDALDGITARLHGGFTRPPKPMAPANAALFGWTREAGQALGLDIAWKATGGVCEGNNLWAAGCPNVDTLGVRGGAIHSEREHASLSSLPERAKLSAVLLFSFASGARDPRALKAAGSTP